MTDLTIILVTLALSAFFSGMEIAFLTSNKLRIELETKQGNLSAKIFSYFNQHPGRFLGTLLLGNNIMLVIFGIYMEQRTGPLAQRFTSSEVGIFLIQTFISTLVILVAAEFIPKSIFRVNPNRILSLLAIPVSVVYYILYPIVYFTTGFSELVLKKIFRVSSAEGKKIRFGRIDLDDYLREMRKPEDTQKEPDHEIRIFRNALRFSSIKARECMIPRNEIIAVNASAPVEELRKKFIQTRLSKILVYNETIDNMIGYVHSHEIFRTPPDIRSILLPLTIVPESMPAREVLTVLLQQRKSVAVVVDEFGGTSGILTMEDVIEEIFGEIEDEHDKEELSEKKISDQEYHFSGRLELDYLNEKYNLELPLSEKYTTLSGLITDYLESIPKLNEKVRIGPYEFIISDVKQTRIERIILTIPKDQE